MQGHRTRGWRRRLSYAMLQALVAVACALLAAPPAAGAQTQARIYRIGWLGTFPPTAPYFARGWEAFVAGLRDHGYLEGQNITFEIRSSEGRADRFPALAAELVQRKVDLIVVITTPAALAAKDATKTIPIVFPTAIDLVGAGLAASLARPGGNVTGLSLLRPELSAKRLELLKEALPRVSRVAVLWNAANPANALVWKDTQGAARTLGVVLQSREVRGPGDFERAFATMVRERPDALFVLQDALTNPFGQQIVDFAARQRLPSMFDSTPLVEAGGLMAYGPSFVEALRRAATFVDKILKGAKPADLPVEQPTRFELAINMKTAKALGITFPPSILVRADQVIQ